MQAWDDPHSGLLLSERLVNCPPQLAPPLNQALFDELAWAEEDEPTQVLHGSGNAAAVVITLLEIVVFSLL